MNDSNHISENNLEAYYMGKVPESELARIEEHLLWCHDCLNQLLASERYIKALQKAAARSEFDVGA
jgi:Putative zinc-finger